MRLSYRNRLIGNFILVIAATGGIATFVGTEMLGERFVTQAQSKVAQDIHSARFIYQAQLEKVGDIVRLTANRFSIRDAIRARDVELLARALGEVRANEALDILSLTDPQGLVLVRSHPGAQRDDSQAEVAPVRSVLREHKAVASTELVPAAELAKENARLPERARIALAATPRARPTERTVESAGMMLLAAAPVLDPDGGLLGVLYGGMLLNRDTGLVDRVKDTVYRGETYQGREIGTATIFLGDVRIATTVRTREGQRALGTRVQAEVGDRVLEQGKPWAERAFVVNGWYLTAYEPIRDLEGRVIGILYVGMREDKFTDLRKETVLIFLGVTVGGMVAAVILALLLARSVLRPIRRLVQASREISAGNFDLRVAERANDELGSLERAFNRMMDAIRERDRQLKEATEAKTRAMLAQSDRLGSLGRLVAGVVHEINNPLTGILTLLKVLRRTLDEEQVQLAALETFKSHLDLAQSETVRCSRIVGGLLDFSRQSRLELAEFDLNELVEKTVAVVQHQLDVGNIKLARRFDPALPRIRMDIGKIQQCVMNMVINAKDAMPGGGTLTLGTDYHAESDEIVIEISDTGVGIPPENLSRIFDPFFTTKDAKGLGLGLSVVYGLVREHGGDVEVDSDVGRGTTFRLRLPAHPERAPGRGAPGGAAPVDGKG
jgi:two-component system NtrC family sensor kinase